MRVGELPGAVHGIAAARGASGADDTQDAHVVFNGGDACLGAVFDHGLEGFDVAVALRTLRQHDGRMLFFIDVTGLQKWGRGAVDADAALGGEVDHALQFVDGGVEAVAFDLRIAADIAYAVAGQVFEVGFVGGSGLIPYLHERGLDGSLR